MHMMLVVITISLMFAFFVHWVVRAAIQSLSGSIKPEITPENFKIDDLDDLDDFGLPEETGVDHSLANNILNSFVAGTFHDPARNYLPKKTIDNLINLDAIGRELKKIERNPSADIVKYDSKFRSQLASWIFGRARKVFAITIQCDLEAYHLLLSMRLFRKHGFDDDKLPLENPRGLSVSSQVFPPQIWTPLKLDNFYDKQWRLLAPVFTPHKYVYDLDAECILPFTPDGAIPHEGTFSSVSRIKIHEDHQTHHGIQYVALKELKIPPGDEPCGIDTAWKTEANALATINKLDHPHIVKCIAAIRRGNSRYLMFPWADGKSLRDYWDQAPRKAPNANIIQQAIVQLRGIADALDGLHNFDGGHLNNTDINNDVSTALESASITETSLPHGNSVNAETQLDNKADVCQNTENTSSIRHGDLKPENILRFLVKQSELGDLKIADMGIAKRHVVTTAQRGDKATSTRFGTRRYEAPETVTEKYARSRLYDIWSMGCITLEFIIWILYGNAELNNLYEQIEGKAQNICQYYELVDSNDPRGARVHPVVSRWMEYIRDKDPECPTNSSSAIKDLLEVVRERLLIVPLPSDQELLTRFRRGSSPTAFGRTVTQYRATAAQFRDALDEILAKANVPRYMFTENNRDGAKPPRAGASLVPSDTFHETPTLL
ncbi:kinase-like domain-containing protein [Pyrenochaeta sp. MPI-SDFR-AT-0127]|nr:kinase-like domain-containing protein [Pyrenochaeta sp. MPI-SDFR-AT-0127]